MISRNNKFAILIATFTFAGNVNSMCNFATHNAFSRTPITEQIKTPDDQKLYDLVYRFGQDWPQISYLMPDYTKEQLKNRWMRMLYQSGLLSSKLPIPPETPPLRPLNFLELPAIDPTLSISSMFSADLSPTFDTPDYPSICNQAPFEFPGSFLSNEDLSRIDSIVAASEEKVSSTSLLRMDFSARNDTNQQPKPRPKRTLQRTLSIAPKI